MENDDEQVGRLLSRREALALLGVAGFGAVAGGSLALPDGLGLPAAAGGHEPLPACVVRPEQTEGPFFVDRMLERSDIRADPVSGRAAQGARLDLTFNVSRVGAGGCAPLAGAQVDVWQCDAAGRYSGVADRGGSSEGERFLRGFQRTGADGRATFVTIYPGWYRGRAVHIHFKIRTDPEAERGAEFVSQLYFDDALTDRVHATGPYAGRGSRDRRNADDGIFRRGGEQLLLALRERQGGGFEAAFEIGVQL